MSTIHCPEADTSGRGGKLSLFSAKERFARRHALLIRSSGAVCTYIPKNGCSTLRYSVAVANGRPEDAATLAYIHTDIADLLARGRDLADCPYSFVILRCPYRRIASSFFDKAAAAHSRARSLYVRRPRLFRPSPGSASGKAAAAIVHEKIMALTFVDFLALLQTRRRETIDHHFRPQSDFLLPRGYDDYFALERLSLATPKLRENANLPIIDGGNHVISRLKKVTVDAAELTIAGLMDLKASGCTPTYESFFNDASRQAVETFFSSDLALYKTHFGSSDLLFTD